MACGTRRRRRSCLGAYLFLQLGARLADSSAYIVAKPSANIKTGADRDALGAEVATWLAGRVAQHKRLRGGVVVVEVIPKSPSGKILRKDLRVRAQAERDAEAQLSAKM